MSDAGGSRSIKTYPNNVQLKKVLRNERGESSQNSTKLTLLQKRKVSGEEHTGPVKKSIPVEIGSLSVGRPNITLNQLPKRILPLPKKQHENILIPPIPPEVWEHIAVYCDLLTLKSLRLCCKMLYAVVNRTIYYRQEGFVMSFKHDKDKNKCYFTKQVALQTGPSLIKRRESVQDLIGVIENSSSFPCHTVRLCGGVLDCSEIPLFFQKQGKMVKKLLLEFCRRQQDSKSVPTNLYIDGVNEFLEILSLTPNLEYLEVTMKEEILVPNGIGIKPISKRIPFQLPALKTFIIPNFDLLSINVVEAILMAAPILENFHSHIRGLRADYINLLVKTDKMQTVKHFHMQPDCVVYNLHEMFASLNPKLGSITLNMWNFAITPHLWSGISSVISRLLESSKDTLKNVVIETPIGFLPQIIWPELKKVVRLRIDINIILFNDPTRRPFATKFLTRDFDWSRVFPSLYDFSISFDHSGPPYPDGWQPIFGNTSSVKRLDLPCTIPFYTSRSPQSLFDVIPITFPNLNHLAVRVTREDFAKVLRMIWTNFSTLKSLSVRFVRTLGMWIRSHIDAVITGFTESVCIKLKEGQVFQELEKLRINPSILNLKDLTEFEILFDCDESWTELSHHDRLLTEVSAWHAFQLLPNLRVKLVVKTRDPLKVEKSFKSISPHITVMINAP